jgi:hypothetical protein
MAPHEGSRAGPEVSPARNLVALAEPSTQLAFTPRRVRLLGLVAAAIGVASGVGLVLLPTGASSATAVVPDGERVETTAVVRDTQVMLLNRNRTLHLLVAYHGDGGWHGVEVQPPPPDSAAAWAATRGGTGVPALSAVYGRATGTRVRVTWADKTVNEVPVVRGVWLVARPGHVRSASVTILGADGAVVSTIDGP